MYNKVENIKIYVTDSDPSVLQISNILRSSAQLAVDNINGVLPLQVCDIVICNNHESTIPETGAGGFSPNPHLIFVYLDTTSEVFLSNISTTVIRTITHELHHTTRSAVFPWENPSILESFIAEGLADNFDIEINGGEPYSWSTALSDEEIASLIGKAKRDKWEKPGGNYLLWNFGKDVPKWSGYSIGFKLVRDYMNKYGKTAAELVHTPADEFVSEQD